MALFEIGADTTSLKVLRDDEMLYDRDQAFGGSQLTQLISRQYGFSFEEAEQKKLAGDLPEDYETVAARALRRQPVAGDRPGAAVLLHQHAAPQGALRDAGRRHRHAAGLKDRVTELTGFASMVVNPFDDMKLGSAVRESQAAPRGAVVPHGLRPGDAEVRAVILINLLPHREERRKRAQGRVLRRPGRRRGRRRRRSSGVWYSGAAAADRRRSRQRNAFLQAEITKLDVADQGHRQPAGRDRRAEGAPEGGRRPADRPQRAGAPAQRAGQADAGRRLPHRRSSRTARSSRSTGIAQTNERVSELLRNTAYNSEWLERPELVEIKAATCRPPAASSGACSTSRCA